MLNSSSLWGILLFLISIQPITAQQVLFPDLEGQILLEALVDNFKPSSLLSSSASRDSMYKYSAINDTLSCVYTGFSIYLNPNLDPSTAAFDQGINAEHTYPKSKGAENFPAVADMHNLFPSQTDVNSDRGSFPFAEIPDTWTDRWYRGTIETTSIPSSNIDEYSELQTSTNFEPREDHKGNVARAMFYFYTMYKSEADNADPNFFNSQRATLCQWHQEDPVDIQEFERSERIAVNQDGKANPFILDCNLAMRTYCSELPALNCLTSTNEPEQEGPLQFQGFAPNPGHGQTTLLFDLDRVGEVEIRLLDALGRQVYSSVKNLSIGQHAVAFQQLNSGSYFCLIRHRDGRQQQSLVKKLIIISN